MLLWFMGSGSQLCEVGKQWGQVILRLRSRLVVDDLQIEVQGNGQSRWIGLTGTYFLGNCLFRTVTLPDPSTWSPGPHIGQITALR